MESGSTTGSKGRSVVVCKEQSRSGALGLPRTRQSCATCHDPPTPARTPVPPRRMHPSTGAGESTGSASPTAARDALALFTPCSGSMRGTGAPAPEPLACGRHGSRRTHQGKGIRCRAIGGMRGRDRSGRWPRAWRRWTRATRGRRNGARGAVISEAIDPAGTRAGRHDGEVAECVGGDGTPLRCFLHGNTAEMGVRRAD